MVKASLAGFSQILLKKPQPRLLVGCWYRVLEAPGDPDRGSIIRSGAGPKSYIGYIYIYIYIYIKAHVGRSARGIYLGINK
jgi:hypothetical protein